MKKVLFINEQYPLPENCGANIRTMLFANFFKKIAAIDLIYSIKSNFTQTNNTIFTGVFHIPRSDYPVTAGQHCKLIRQRFPWCVRARHSKKYLSSISSILQKTNYDLIFIRYPFNAQYFLPMPSHIRRKVILDFDDLISGSLYPLMFSVKSKYALKRWFDYRLAVSYEKQCCSNLGAVLFCSKKDLEKRSYNRFANTFVVPNIINPAGYNNFDFGDGYSVNNNFLFVGSLDYDVNIEGLIWFIKNIFTPFKSKYKDTLFFIAGRNPKEDIKKILLNTKGVELHANVSDIRPLYAKAKLIIVPLLKGSGTRIKILEAALAERPVLSTSVGVEGLSFEDDREILIFNDLNSFTEKFIKLQNKKIYNEITDRAKAKTKDEYSINNFNNILNSLLYRLEHSQCKI